MLVNYLLANYLHVNHPRPLARLHDERLECAADRAVLVVEHAFGQCRAAGVKQRARVETGRRASEVCRLFTPVPQLLRSVRYGDGRPLESPAVKQVIADGETRLATAGRLVIRESGTEPVIRVMAESEDEALIATVIDEICEAISVASVGAEDARPRLLRSTPLEAAE